MHNSMSNTVQSSTYLHHCLMCTWGGRGATELGHFWSHRSEYWTFKMSMAINAGLSWVQSKSQSKWFDRPFDWKSALAKSSKRTAMILVRMGCSQPILYLDSTPLSEFLYNLGSIICAATTPRSRISHRLFCVFIGMHAFVYAAYKVWIK
jgi:hypothetical protein